MPRWGSNVNSGNARVNQADREWQKHGVYVWSNGKWLWKWHSPDYYSDRTAAPSRRVFYNNTSEELPPDEYVNNKGPTPEEDELTSELGFEKSRYQSALSRLGPEHPKTLATKQEVERLEKAIQAKTPPKERLQNVTKLIESAKTKHESKTKQVFDIKLKIAELWDSLETAASEVKDLDRKLVELHEEEETLKSESDSSLDGPPFFSKSSKDPLASDVRKALLLLSRVAANPKVKDASDSDFIASHLENTRSMLSFVEGVEPFENDRCDNDGPFIEECLGGEEEEGSVSDMADAIVGRPITSPNLSRKAQDSFDRCAKHCRTKASKGSSKGSAPYG